MEKNLGHATAYGYAKSKGYSGTEDEFAELMADYASVGQSAAQSAEQAAASATSASGSAATASQAAQTATGKASEAVTAAGTATTKASEASTSASTASSAATSASTSAQTATTAAATATAKASEASESATTATTAKTDAESARDAAAQSASEAAESARTLTIDATLTQAGQAADSKVVGDKIEGVRSELDKLADFSEPAEIVNDTFSQTGTGRKTFTAGNLESGSEITVDVVPDSWTYFSWDILTSNVVGGSTKRVISGGNSTNQETRTTFTLASDEHAITIRCIVNAQVTPTPTRTGTVIATSTDPSALPVIKEEVLPHFIADMNDTINRLDDTISDVITFPSATEIINDTFTQSGAGTTRFSGGDIPTGSIVTVEVNPDAFSYFQWDILTSNVVGGSTIRTISGGNGSNQITQKDIELQEGEHAITVRCIVTSGATATRTGTVKASYVVSGAVPMIKDASLPDTSRIDKSKRIVWFGTSIPAGSGYDLNYPLSLGRKLGVTVYNEAVGSSRARASWAEFVTASNPLGAGSAYGSLIKAMGYTLAEKQYFIDNYDSLKSQFVDTHPEALDADTQLLIKNYSFERKLYRYLNTKEAIYKTVNNDGFIGDVDIYVLDHGYNDVTTRYASDTTIPELGASNEMYYFAGALNRYIKEIMENNITAKIIIISHYANDEGTKDAVAVRMQNEVAQYWNIPIINIYKEIGWTNVEITINGTTKTVRNFWLPDGIHPHSDATGRAINRYVDILYPYFADILHM